MSKTRLAAHSLFILFAFFAVLPPALAKDFHCEVLSLRGKVTATNADGETRALDEGDLVSPGEVVAADKMSSVDLAFDKEWKNIVRVESETTFEVVAVHPSKLKLTEGAIFAKLKNLPKDSTFEVKTPTAVATVRGTEYRTTFLGGTTRVMNVSPSPVYVYGVDEDGAADVELEIVLEQSQKTQILEAGAAPDIPQALPAEEQAVTDTLRTEIENNIEIAETSGRVAKIQSISEVEKVLKEMEAARKPANPQVEPNESDESRVTDLRRRPFKKVD